MVYPNIKTYSSCLYILLAVARVGLSDSEDSNAIPAATPFPTGEEDDRHLVAIAEYGLTFECYQRDDGLGECFHKQCQEACGVPDDKIPEGCVKDGVSPKRRQNYERPMLNSVSCIIGKDWVSLSGSGPPTPGRLPPIPCNP